MKDRIATYRVQLRPDWGFDEAADIVGYLRDLGVSHLYTSPVAASEPGSTHGYDVVDPTRVDDELGGEAGLARLRDVLRDHGMLQLADVVPNHVSVASRENRWWWDVLSRGRASRYATWFDIDWEAPGAEGRVLLPVLGAPLADVRDELRVEDTVDGPVLRYWERTFPLAEGSHGLDLDELLAAQHYRLVWWRDPAAPTYRRFFDITDLAGLCVEVPEAFEASVALLSAWRGDDVFDGVRVDHVDGLADPAGFARALRRVMGPDRILVVEKILEAGEDLPEGWEVDGTTGYEAADLLTGLFVDPSAESALDGVVEAFTGRRPDWGATVDEAKALVLDRLLVAEVGRLERALARALGVRGSEPSSSEDREVVVRTLLSGFDVYRTYVDTDPGSLGAVAGDRRRISSALGRARVALRDPEQRRLAAETADLLADPTTVEARDLARRFQQTTPPVAAKAVEDTALYRFPRLVARNEVGCDPSRLSWSPGDLHAAMQQRCRWRAPLTTTSTHDTKRSEDVRARITALSLLADEWAEAVVRWRERTVEHRSEAGPGPELELLAWQTLVGAWPIGPDRLVAYLTKAAREAKLRTSWRDGDDDYELAIERWVAGVLADDVLLAEVASMVERIREPAMLITLAAVTLKLTVPGVPDLYQGTEVVDLSLVDPDNRRPVDYGRRRALLASVRGRSAAEVWAEGDLDACKLLVTHRLLGLRADHPGCFGPDGGYEPCEVTGADADHLVAFARDHEVVTVVPRLVRAAPHQLDAVVSLPAPGLWVDALTGREHDAEGVIPAMLFDEMPVSVLVRR